jgi:hypothetical protein
VDISPVFLSLFLAHCFFFSAFAGVRVLLTLLLLVCAWGNAAAVNVVDLFGASGRTWQVSCIPSTACGDSSGNNIITIIDNITGMSFFGCLARMQISGRG